MPRLLPYLFLTMIVCVAAHPQDRPRVILPDSGRVPLLGSPSRGDTVRTDTLRADSLGRMNTPTLVGSYDRTLDSSRFISREQLTWTGLLSLTDILERFEGVFIRRQFGTGQHEQLSIRGVDWRAIGFTLDGRPLNDPISGVYNLSQFTAEYGDRIEVLTGPRAFLYAGSSTGGAVNLLTKNYNSNRPFTKLNYSEGPYTSSYSDGTFSQNVSRKVNVTFGFQHRGEEGRFTNGTHEAWNMRAKVRYNPVSDLNIIVSEYLTSSQTDLNGGVIPEGDLSFDPRLATVVNPDAYEKVTRHDVNLSVLGSIFGDTANVSTLTLYYSHNKREYRDEENRRSPNGIFVQQNQVSSWMGALLTQELGTSLQQLTLGAEVEARKVNTSPTIGRRSDLLLSAWGREAFRPARSIEVSAFGRVERYRGASYLGAGGDVTFRISDAITFFGGASFSNRLPNYTELFWADSAVSRPRPIFAEKHRVLETGAELALPNGGSFRAAYFHRSILDPILALPFAQSGGFAGVQFLNGSTASINGVEAAMSLRVWVLTLEGTAAYQRELWGGADPRRFPRLHALGGLYFWNDLAGGKLQLKTGFRGRYQSTQRGELFNPELLTTVLNTGPELGYGSSVDFVLIGHIGDAFIHLIWENLTNVQYYASPYYPVLDRGVRFGIAWEFTN